MNRFLSLVASLFTVKTPTIEALTLTRGDVRAAAPKAPAPRELTLEEIARAAARYEDKASTRLFDLIKSLSLVDATPSSHVGRPVRAEWNYDRAVSEGLKASTWVYACVFKLAQSAGSVAWYGERRVNGKWQRVDDSPLTRLLGRPNPLWSGSTFVERVVYSLYLGGEAYITKIRATGPPLELWAHTPRDVSPIPGGDALIAAFEFKISGKPTRRVSPSDCFQICFPDPSNNFRGLSPLQVAAGVVDAEAGAVDWNRNAIANRAVVDGVLTFKHDLSEEEHLNALHQIDRSYAGPTNARRPLVIGNDATFNAMSMTPVEMDFLNSRKMSREEICAVYGVPPVLVGILDRATYSNYATARDVFWLDTVIPLLNDLAEAMTLGVAAEFGDDWRVAYDTSSISALHKISADRIDAATALHRIGVPLNVLNERFRLNLPVVEGGDTPFVNGVPLARLLEGATAGEASAPPSARQLAAARQLIDATREILSRAAAGEASDEDLDVVDELDAELSSLLNTLRGRR